VLLAVVCAYNYFCAAFFVTDAGWFCHWVFVLLGGLVCAADLAVAGAFVAVRWALYWSNLNNWGGLFYDLVGH
jgi:hypothetical protein